MSFYDFVLSAPKSYTLVWVGAERAARDAAAAGDEAAAAEHRALAEGLEECLMEAHRAALDFLAAHASFARKGHHGGGAGEWVDAPDLVSTQFLQHDSREHDPQLHVHGPTANRTVCPADGKVRALDYSLLIQWRDGASAFAERYLEALAWQRYGLRWETGPDGESRQICGVDPAASDLFSKRTAAITPTLEKLVSKFRAETGRQPTNRELAALSERASTQTRAAKQFGTETRDGQLARWAPSTTPCSASRSPSSPAPRWGGRPPRVNGGRSGMSCCARWRAWRTPARPGPART